ncbi:MAG: hypothetical protein IT331_05235 [Anaerolineae bacterium]|nr:hypothetical protein [Anaerolineae bacterium]
MDSEKSMQPEQELNQMVLTQVIRMNATINGIVAGLLIGVIFLIATLWLVIKGGEVVGPHLGLLDQYFWGYSVTYFGSLVGFFYGFVVGFAIGYFVSWTYNLLADLRARLRDRLARRRQKVSLPKPEYNPVVAPPIYSASLPNSAPNGNEPAHSGSKSRL